MERHCTIGDIAPPRPRVGAAAPRAAVAATSRRWSATTRSSGSPCATPSSTSEARGWVVESVETENRGFDLISRRPHPTEPRVRRGPLHRGQGPGRRRRGRALRPTSTGPPSGSASDYWLYVVFDCGSTPTLKPSRTRRGSDGSRSSESSSTTSTAKTILEAAL